MLTIKVTRGNPTYSPSITGWKNRYMNMHSTFPDPLDPFWVDGYPTWQFPSYPSGLVDLDSYLSLLRATSLASGALESRVPVTYIDLKQSINTPHFASLLGKRHMSLKLTKIKKQERKRSEPRLHLSRLPKKPVAPKEPLVPPDAGTRYRVLTMQTYYTKLAAFKRALSFYEKSLRSVRAKRSTQVKAYKKALSDYNAYLSRQSAKLPVTYAADRPRNDVLPDNPFTHIQVIPGSDVKWLQGRYEGPIQVYLQAYPEDKLRLGIPADSDQAYPYGHFDDYIGRRIWSGSYGGRDYVESKDLTDSQLSLVISALHTSILSSLDSEIADAKHRVDNKLLSKIKKQEVHIGNILAERKQTLELFSSTFKRLYSIIKLKKNLLKVGASYLRDPKKIADDVLAFQFGVKPLVSDIQAFAKYLDSPESNPIVIARGNRKVPLRFEDGNFRYDLILNVSHTLKMKVSNPISKELSAFGLINPLEILWEVTPWSFVIDWFIPVGEYLSQHTADCGLEFLTGTETVTIKGSVTTKVPVSIVDPVSGQLLETSGTFSGNFISRTVKISAPSIKLPRIKNPLSWSHGVSTVALIVQRLKR
jgi:hypothetical protein